MKIAVTGGAGFIGSHVCDVLQEQGRDFEIFDRLAPRGHYSFRSRGVVNLEEGGYSFYGFDAVIHLAAYADISRNWVSRYEREDLYRDNIYALIATLEASPPDQPFVFVSSCAVGLSDSPYAATKRLGEDLTKSYKPKHGKVVRLVSCVGERYSHGHIKDFVDKAKRGEPIIPLDDGRSPKSFVHVRDAAEAIVNQATNGEVNQGLDIVGAALGRSKEVYTVAAGTWGWRDTLAMMGIQAERWEDKRSGWRGDPVGLRVDSSWHCKRSVGEGVREALVSLGWTR